jgi:hypothetical protein
VADGGPVADQVVERGEQRLGVHRSHHVGVAPRAHADLLVLFGDVERGHVHHRQLRRRRPAAQQAAHLESEQVGQVHVEHDGRYELHELQSLGPCRRLDHVEPGSLQAAGGRITGGLGVVHHQHAVLGSVDHPERGRRLGDGV